MSVQPHALAALPPGKTRCSLYKRLVSTRAYFDGCGKSRFHRDSIPGPFTQPRVATPTKQSRPCSMSYSGIRSIRVSQIRQSGVLIIRWVKEARGDGSYRLTLIF